MPDENVNPGTQSTGNAAATGAPVTQETQSTVTPTQQGSQPSSQASSQEDSSGKSVLGGDGNWFKPENYGLDGLPPEHQEKLKSTLKEVQRVFSQKRNEDLAKVKQFEGKQYAFKDAKEMVEKIKNDYNLQAEIERIREEEEAVHQQFAQSKPSMVTMLDKWENVPPNLQKQYIQGLSEAEYLSFRTAYENKLNRMSAEQQRMQEQVHNFHSENEKKYSDYKELVPQINDFLANQVKNINPLELAYRYIAFEKYGKNMYDKAKQELNELNSRVASSSGVIGTSMGASKVNNSGHKSPRDHLMDTIKEYKADPKSVNDWFINKNL